MKFARCLPLLLGNILYKYELYRSLDNKVMNLYLTVCRRVRRTSHTFLLYFPTGVVKCNCLYPFYISFNYQILSSICLISLPTSDSDRIFSLHMFSKETHAIF